MKLANIHSIESFGTVDGPGVRFVVFLQGCPLRCLYCHNPDTWVYTRNTQMSVDEILSQYEKNEAYYKSGGLTLTGGEPLMQMDFAIELFEACKQRGIHTCLDTSGITFSENKLESFKRLAACTDLVLLDLKHVDNDKHVKLTKYSNKNVFQFLEFLNEENVPIWVRHVYISEKYESDQELIDLGFKIGLYTNIKAVDVLPYHSMGRVKYENMKLDYALEKQEDVSDEVAKQKRTLIIQGIKEARIAYKNRNL